MNDIRGRELRVGNDVVFVSTREPIKLRFGKITVVENDRNLSQTITIQPNDGGHVITLNRSDRVMRY